MVYLIQELKSRFGEKEYTMKKTTVILIAFALILLAGNGALAQANPLLGETMPDFTVTTCDGDEVSLSALLAEKDLVLVNVFTSWCPPCRVEFPIMQAVYEDYADRVEIVALSNEKSDTADIIADYKAQLGLTFPMASATGTGVVRFAKIMSYPTTLFIDKSGKIVLYETLPFVFESQFSAAVDHFLADDCDGEPAVLFNLYVCDADGHPAPGARVSLCTDEICVPLVSSDEGVITFVGKPDDYHLQILSLPEGCSVSEGFEPLRLNEEWSLIEVEREPGCLCD